MRLIHLHPGNLSAFRIMLFVLFMQASSVSATTDGDLVGHWKFDEADGTQLHDSSGHAPAGRIIDPEVSRIEGRLGSALRFTGRATQAQIPHYDALNFGTGDFTIAFWVRFERVRSPFADTPLSKNGIGDPCRNLWTSRGWTIFMEAYAAERSSDGRWVRDHERAGPFLRLTDGLHVDRDNYPGRISAFQDDLSDGRWHHVAFVRRGPQQLEYYTDGAVRNSISSIRQPEAHFDNPASPLTFGCGFTGDLDEVRIYRRALDPAEIARLFHDPS